MVLFWVSLQRTEARCVAGALGSGPAWAPHCPSLGLTFLTRGRGSAGKVVRPVETTNRRDTGAVSAETCSFLGSPIPHGSLRASVFTSRY